MLNNISPSNRAKKVSIIIPVYNAEKYLGYCLNSVLSQTYTNWNAILVDDGSTDSSLEICRNYEAIDSRFRVISKPNGGVSSARNAGLACAEGDYLEFLDSDDCLTQDALEKQVSLAIENDSQLVVMDSLIVDFNNPRGSRVMLNSSWLNQSPCVLSAEEFREKRMRLLWFTALLEGPVAKLYDLSLWKQLDIRFPEDLSLGEDFVSNMKYYAACNKAVFLNECGYYYNQYVGSGSLTEKYRPDLFENKMYLMDKLEDHLGGRDSLSEPELDAFYSYAASSGLVCVEKTVMLSGMDKDQMAARLREMFAHPLFAESIQKAGYIPERFVACINPAIEDQMEWIIQYISNEKYRKSQEAPDPDLPTAEATRESVPVRNSGLLNRIIRKVMRKVTPLFGHGRVAERLTRLESEIAQYGLKYTFQAHVQFNRRRNRDHLEHQLQQLEYKGSALQEQMEVRLDDICRRIDAGASAMKQELNARWYGVYNRLEERCNALENQLRENAAASRTEFDTLAQALNRLEERCNALENQLRENAAASRTEFDTLAQALNDEFNTQATAADERISAAVAKLQENINGYTWITEQRMIRYAYQRDINELRQRKKVIILASAEHDNIGDAAITLAEQQLLSEQFPEYFQVEISTYEFNQKEAFLHAILNKEDILFINGGGNMGDLYPEEEELHRKIAVEFPNNKIIIFPQTISFSEAETDALMKSARVYNSHKDLTLFVRGKSSLAFAQKHFDKVKTILMPDMVHMLRSDYAFDRSGALLCLRDDGEGKLDAQKKEQIIQTASALTGSIDRSSNTHTEDVSREIRGFVVRKELMCFARHQVVVTDRLHGMIFSAVTGTPCVVLSSYNHKIQEYYEAFFQDSNAVFFIGDDVDRLEDAVKDAMQVTQAQYPVFEKNLHSRIRSIAMER